MATGNTQRLLESAAACCFRNTAAACCFRNKRAGTSPLRHDSAGQRISVFSLPISPFLAISRASLFLHLYAIRVPDSCFEPECSSRQSVEMARPYTFSLDSQGTRLYSNHDTVKGSGLRPLHKGAALLAQVTSGSNLRPTAEFAGPSITVNNPIRVG